ncbi:Nose resistant to fluoxetine protein 6 [Pseudolycoriella hygida]|uniref:Nose resistant to fluoxetine protein 6 n=1 Tax=Pseudolycoriella hygida TaxID=35572 RepID=A0A9Q0MZF6_9DIPT|nr:Nose resistant to fluoxetine protein 6 [Pseudolycoriella hygida]
MNALEAGIAAIGSSVCSIDLKLMVNGLKSHMPWAISMYDSSVKAPSGVELGSIYQFGSFDECMGISKINENLNIKPKYCLADVTLDGYSVRSDARRDFKTLNSTIIHWGICMPASCSSNDVAMFLIATTGHSEVIVNDRMCHTEGRIELTSIDIFYGCVITAFVTMILLCTTYHVYIHIQSSKMKNRPNSSFQMLLLSFSFIENLQKLVKGSKDDLGLSAINGIKAISMMLIIAGHALVFMIGGPVLNADFYAKEIKLVQNAFLINSPLLVDSFLLLSGFLFARLLLIELDKRRGRVNFILLYIFRYIRLTPAYLAIIALYATWLPKLGSGPLWDSRMNLEQERCQSSWWLNLLYVNNYFGTDKICMFQSWYLAADTQLFILAPIVLYPLWKYRRFGYILLTILTFVSILIPLFVTYSNDYDPSLLPYADEVTDISQNYFFVNVYIKTHMRATAYIFGIFTGALVHYLQQKKTTLPNSVIYIGWLTAITVGIASMFSVVIFFDQTYTRLGKSLYAGLHRVGWSFSTSWIILACVLNCAGPLKTILTSRALTPFSRLTYCAYLMNGLVELYQAGTIRVPKYMSTFILLGDTLSHVMVTFIGALVLCLVFESPIHGIEKILLRREQKQQNTDLSSSSSSSTYEGSA